MKRVLKGNSAVAEGVRLARPQVISAYPITPQTTIIEDIAAMVSSGALNAKFIKVESEHSAMAGCIAAASVGARTFTATSSQGLALMHELIHWAAGQRCPVVLANVNRAMAPGWSIWTDQNDSLSQRDTGWMQVYCSSAQEVLDSVIQAYKVSERVLMPTMIILDAFFLSHTYEVVDVPEADLVDRFLPPINLTCKLDIEKPGAFGNLVYPDRYMEFRFKMELALRRALKEWCVVGREWEALTGRGYDLLEGYRLEDAEIVLFTAATAASTARPAIDALRQQGIPVGLLRLRVFRPFPYERVREALGGRRNVVVLDRNCSYGHHGIFHQELKSAMFTLNARPRVHGVIAGLGGRDITVEDIQEMITKAWRGEMADEVTWWDTQPVADDMPVAVG